MSSLGLPATVEMKSWRMFTEFATDITAKGPPRLKGFLFRGQSNAEWKLTPCLLRYFPERRNAANILQLERYALLEFKSQAHLYLPTGSIPSLEDKSAPEWWALMQHHHAPTRLLDWTYSPFVAAYFAVASPFNLPGVVYAVSGYAVLQPVFKAYGSGPNERDVLHNEDAPAMLTAFHPQRRSQRLVAQQGAFLMGLNVAADHDALIAAACEIDAKTQPPLVNFLRYIIPATLKREFLARLQTMNITAQSLFPGIDGLGRGISEHALLEHL